MSPFVVALVLLSAVMHASWNLLARRYRTGEIFLHILLVIASVGVPTAVVLELSAEPVFSIVWRILLISAVFQAVYFWGVTHAYRSGDFTIVYPLSRSLPVLFIAFADLLRGHTPSALGWAGIVLVTAGCIIIPLQSPRNIGLARYLNRTILWVLVTAGAIVGYTIFDSIANLALQGGAASALRYNVYETSLSLIGYVAILKVEGRQVAHPHGWRGWRFPVLAAVLVFGSYSLILWAYQLTPFASYVSAMRQVSIVIGAIVGTLLFREPAPALRISAALVILAGAACIAAT
jgi:drug/metabolite transporter (DMT)-like permease